MRKLGGGFCSQLWAFKVDDEVCCCVGELVS